MKRAALLVLLAACEPGSRCPVAHGEVVSARPLRCADLLEDTKRFDGQTIDVRGRIEYTALGPRVRLLDRGASGDCGRIAGTGIILRLPVDKNVERDCTRALNRKFIRVVGTLTASPDPAGGTVGEVTPLAIVPEGE